MARSQWSSRTLRHPASRALTVWMWLATALCSAQAADVLPPLVAMSHPEFLLVAGSIEGVEQEPPSLLFRIDESLRGEATGTIKLLVERGFLDQVAPGRPLLALYSDLKPAPLKPRKMLHDPSQTRLLSFDGVPLSLFPDSPEWRQILTRPKPAEWSKTPEYRTRLINGLSDPDPAWRDLWSAELALRVDHLLPFSAAEQKTIRDFADSPLQPPEARARLFAVALERDNAFGEDWLDSALAPLLRDLAPLATGPMSAPQQRLVHVGLRIARDRPGHVPAETLAIWLQASPVLAESAAVALRALSPERERTELDAVLSRTFLPAITRNYLEQHQQRLPTQSGPNTTQ